MKGSVTQVIGFVSQIKTITNSIAPFPPRSKVAVINPIEKSELKNWYKMGKKGKHFHKTSLPGTGFGCSGPLPGNS